MYSSTDIEQCRSNGHRFTVVGSDKTPLKRSLRCDTCSLASATDAYAAYGDETKSFGEWRHQKRNEESLTA